ncbi:uncharacterized protein DFL_000656 [Arthrobotrys flagrans]|uniref:Uncharacterized protein n=1 Tax=Arthrobotrys flagrans TaxID=97331 RepID=A0A437AEU9_ARTFL|nr:hypothetical protein DFL_000656 [Arthrobotrys flagrans]
MLFRFASRNKLFRQGWINWFLLPYHQHRDGFADLNLRVVAFRHPITIDPDRPDYFSTKANTSEVVRHHFPETWEFFQGYNAQENQSYVWPKEDTNVAQGVFEDEDELENLMVRRETEYRDQDLVYVCPCVMKRQAQSIDSAAGTELTDTFKSSTVAVQDTG